MAFSTFYVVCMIGLAAAQQIGKTNIEGAPPMPIQRCTRSGGCTTEDTSITLDANWRWFHGAKGGSTGNCYTAGKWDDTMCPDPKTCTENCGIDGVTLDAYESTYGVSKAPGGVKLTFVTEGQYGKNVGSRLYMLDGSKYKLFQLKNREMSFTVDVSALPCGLNGAVYFVEMKEDGGLGEGNKAGAKYGTGYCDAQCPHDVKFMGGEANILDWDEKASTGRYGHCCTELDVFEANSFAAAMTPHPCNTEGPLICDGTDCGDNAKGERYAGVCDKDGCDFNSFRMGDQKFLGAGMTVDTRKPITIVTQWLTHDGTDSGDLVEMKRFYVQDGKVIKNSEASIQEFPDVKGNSITDEFCSAQKHAFGDRDDHKLKGGLKAMGKVMDRGMVLVLSLWDDELTGMTWLDTASPAGQPESKPGVLRGPCPRDSGAPADLRLNHPDSSVIYANFKYGEIGSTFDGANAIDTTAAVSSETSSSFVPSPPANGGVSSKPFCCLAATNHNNFCGTCFDGAKAEPNSLCGKSQTACAGCGGHATWCGGANSSQSEPKEDDGFCCLASPENGDFCGKCFKGAIAQRNSRCGASADACHACGGKATWCGTKPKNEEGFCCLASPDPNNFCGKCFKGAEAGPHTTCGKSSSACRNCGQHSTWCPKSPQQSLPEYDCEVGFSNWANSWSTAKKEHCCKEEGKGCPVEKITVVSDDSNSEQVAEESFCCMASPDKNDFCGKCFHTAKVFKDKHCGKDWMACHNCGGHATWCSHDTSGIETRKLSLEVTDGRDYLLPENPVGKELALLTSDATAKVKVVAVSAAES